MQTTEMQMMNGVDRAALGATIEAIENKPEIAKFEFRVKNRWLGGGLNESSIKEFYGACQEDTTRTAAFVMRADEPPVLLGADGGANPVEYLLHALAACMTTSMVYHAAARGIEIEEIRSELSGDLDLRGFLGMTTEVRKGYREIRVRFTVKSNATAEQLMQLIHFSPVFDMVTNGVPVHVGMECRS